MALDTVWTKSRSPVTKVFDIRYVLRYMTFLNFSLSHVGSETALVSAASLYFGGLHNKTWASSVDLPVLACLR